MMHPAQVLLIEDNPGDADLTRDSLQASKMFLRITVVQDGEDALDYLHARGRHEGVAPPDLVILDLNLPKIGGREVLADIKQNKLKAIPVVVLTSSDAEKDIAASYELGANCYITKPVDLCAFQSIVRAIEGFWFNVVKLP